MRIRVFFCLLGEWLWSEVFRFSIEALPLNA